MTVQQTISERIIQYFVHPISKDHPIHFRDHLKKATRILIVCPSDGKITAHSKTISEIIRLFPQQDLVVLVPGSDVNSAEMEKIQLLIDHAIITSNLEKHSLWSLLTSKSLKQLNHHRFEVLLDLNPEFSLLNIYLCRLLHPPVRIAFSKPHSSRYYNVCYNGKPSTSYNKKFERFSAFLKSLLS
jgi:hypothetical protein